MDNEKIYIPDGEESPESQIGASLEALCATIADRSASADEGSYTYRLLSGNLDSLLKKVVEEAGETVIAAKEAQMLGAAACAPADPCASAPAPADAGVDAFDAAIDHLRYEAGDVIYHLMVLLARFGIDTDELAAELNTRMNEDERPDGCVRLHDSHVKRR